MFDRKKYFSFSDYAGEIGFSIMAVIIGLVIIGELIIFVNYWVLADQIRMNAAIQLTLINRYTLSAIQREGIFRSLGIVKLVFAIISLPFSCIGLGSLYRKTLAIFGIVMFVLFIGFFFFAVF